MLPPASTIQGVPVIIRDWSGLAETNPIYVSTQLNDLIDSHASTIILDRAYQSFRVVPYDTTHYAITANYTEGLMPYEYAIQLLLEFFLVSLNRSWSALAVGPDGSMMLAVTNGGSNPGFYVSVDFGRSFSRFTGRTGNYVSCAVSQRRMFAADAGVIDEGRPVGGYLYYSQDDGLTWDALLDADEQPWISIVTNTAGDVVLAITSLVALFSVDQGFSFRSLSFAMGAGSTYTGCAIADPPSFTQDDIVLYISVQGSDAEFIYRNINPTEGGQFLASGSPQANWIAVCCSLSGSIAYGLTDTGFLYKTTDTGTTWTSMTTPEPFLNRQLQCSDDGQILYGINGLNIYLTEDGAQTFRLLDPIADITGILLQSGLSRDGLISLFSSTKTDGDTTLNVGRTRIQ
jgi:hypothetical protein